MYSSGAFKSSNYWEGGNYDWAAGAVAGIQKIPIINFSASDSNPVYGSSDTVTPRSTTCFCMIKY